jgi:hypothetical protein
VTISARGLCMPCAADRMIQPGVELRERSGPAYDEWCRAMIAHAQTLVGS